MPADIFYNSTKYLNMLEQQSNFVYVTLCVITKIYPDELMADIYIPEKTKSLLKIPFIFPSKGKNYGAFFIPEVGQTCLLIRNNLGQYYILGAGNFSNNVNNKEILFGGENLIQSTAGNFIRQDLTGNNIIATFGSNIMLNKYGVESLFSIGHQIHNLATNIVSGYTLNVNNTGIVVPVHQEKYYDKFEISPSYCASDLLLYENNNIVGINNELERQILNNANQNILKINNFINLLQNMNMQNNSEISQQIQEYKINRNLVLVIEKGCVVNTLTDNIVNTNNLNNSSIEKSADNNIIYFRLRIINPETKTTTMNLEIDQAGNVILDCKKLILNVEEYQLNYK